MIVENSVKGLQEDEVAFLDHVSDQQIAIEKARNNEEARVIRELRISFLHVMCRGGWAQFLWIPLLRNKHLYIYIQAIHKITSPKSFPKLKQSTKI